MLDIKWLAPTMSNRLQEFSENKGINSACDRGVIFPNQVSK